LPSESAERSLALVCRRLFAEPSPLLSMGRFELLRTLGHGGMGVAYEAYDPLRQERVALKTVHDRGPTSLYRLKREFRSLTRLHHPNLVALHELWAEPEAAFFTMELVHGCDFVSHVRAGVLPGDAPPETRLHDAFAQLCEGVNALHLAGKLHRDLKPSNVLVTEQGRVVVLDFGLTLDVGDRVTEPGGTPEYMAPEQRLGQAAPASDWYSVGRIFREALYGRGPRAAVDVLANREGRPESPAPLEHLCEQLLSLDAANRPGFAQLARALGRPAIWTRAMSWGAWRADVPYVGRAAELGTLEAIFEQSKVRPVMALVCGDSGIGKSALVEHFVARHLPRPDAVVLRGRCYERESVPYRAFDSLIDDLTSYLLSEPKVYERAVPGAECAALLQLFPALARAQQLTSVAALPEHEHATARRARAFVGLKRLLGAIAREHPLVLCIDDLQWSDEDSTLLLRCLLYDGDAPPLMIVACDRARDDATISGLSAALRSDLCSQTSAVFVVELGPLSEDEALELAERLEPTLALDDTSALHTARESEGSPLLIGALSRFKAVGASSPATRSGEASTIDALIGAQLERLSEQTVTLLRLVALAGRPLPLALLAQALSSAQEPYSPLDTLRAERLVHARGGPSPRLEVEHASVNAAVLRRLDDEERRSLHLRLAHALEQSDEPWSELLSDQYLAAGEPIEAARHARHAAEQALAALAFASAARLFQRALSLGRWERPELATLHCALANALEYAGVWEQAVDAYLKAAELSVDSVDAARCEQLAAEHLVYNGHHERAEALVRRGYRALGLRWPQSRVGLALAVGGRLLARALYAPRTCAVELREPLQARAEYLAGAGRVLENGDLLRAVYNALLCFDASEQLGDARFRERARGGRAFVWSAIAPGMWRRRSVVELTRACDQARLLHDHEGHFHMQRQLAALHLLGGSTRDALRFASACEESLRSLRTRPIDLDMVTAALWLALLELGELRELRARCAALEGDARVRGSLSWAALRAHPAYLALLLSDDDRERANEVVAEWDHARADPLSYPMLRWVQAAGRVEHALYARQVEEALDHVLRDQHALTATSYSFFTDEARLLRARAHLSVAARERDPEARRKLLRRAAADQRVLARRRGRMANGPVQLLGAQIAFLEESVQHVHTRLSLAVQQADAAGWKLFAASVRYCHGALLGPTEGAPLRSAAAEVLRAEGVARPTRWVGWLAPGFQPMVDSYDG
jgi:eukaryotic-like serine/threonine-protein kinase